MTASVHEDLTSRDEVDMGSERSFGFVFTAVFLIVALYPVYFGSPVRWWAVGIAVAILAISLLRSGVLKPFNRAWFRFGMLLNRVVSPVVMTLVFHLTITPTGLIFRALRKDLLRLRFDPDAETYWETREPKGPATERMRNQF